MSQDVCRRLCPGEVPLLASDGKTATSIQFNFDKNSVVRRGVNGCFVGFQRVLGENGIYAVFSNPIGLDYDTIKPGLAMIIDPYGEVLTESHVLDDDVVVALLTAEKIETSPGRRYLKARRPELYDGLRVPQESVTLPGWSIKTK